MLTLRYWPDEALTAVCLPAVCGDELRALGGQMIELLGKVDAVGLAACQVGILKRFFVMTFPNETHDPTPPAIICNPVLSEFSDERNFAREGCVSLPGVYEQVERSAEVTMDYQTPDGEQRTMVLDGIEARIAQHETDHLDGVNFFDRVRMPRNLGRQVMRAWADCRQFKIAESKRRLAG